MSRLVLERASLAFFRSIRRTRLPIYEPYDWSLYLTYENLRTTFVHKSYKVVYRFSPVNPFELKLASRKLYGTTAEAYTNAHPPTSLECAKCNRKKSKMYFGPGAC